MTNRMLYERLRRRFGGEKALELSLKLRNMMEISHVDIGQIEHVHVFDLTDGEHVTVIASFHNTEWDTFDQFKICTSLKDLGI